MDSHRAVNRLVNAELRPTPKSKPEGISRGAVGLTLPQWNALRLQRSIGNAAVCGLLQGNVAARPPQQVQRLIIDLPPIDNVPKSIDTDHIDAQKQIDLLKGHPQALRVVRDRLLEKKDRNKLEDRALDQAQSLLKDDSAQVRETSEIVPQLTKEIWLHVVSYLTNTKDLVKIRTMSKALRRVVELEAGRRVPYPDKAIFVLANLGVFPNEFAKGNFTEAPIQREENVRLSWQQYRASRVGSVSFALVMRMFETDTFKGLVPAQEFEELQLDQVIFRPVQSGKWTPQIDDSWILGHIHKRSTIMIMCDPTDLTNFWDSKAKRITATAREIWLAMTSGYTVQANALEGEGITGGLWLIPPKQLKSPTLLPNDPQGDLLTGVLSLVRSVTNREVHVDNASFPKLVAGTIDQRILKQKTDTMKNYKTKMIPKFLARENDVPGWTGARKTAVSLLCPDSYLIPYDRQVEYRKEMWQAVMEEDFLANLGTKTGYKKKKTDFTEELGRIFKDAEELASGKK